MSLKKSSKKHKKSIIKKAAFTIVKPFLPFFIIFIVLLFAFCTVIDAIFVDAVQQDSSSMSKSEAELQLACMEKADYLNTCHNYRDGEEINELLDVDNREQDKEVHWAHLYSLMVFHNIIEGRAMDYELLDDVASYFESTFTYETYHIRTELDTQDKKAIEENIITDKTVYLLVESMSIYGHYKYHYEEKSTVSNGVRTTTKVFTHAELVGEAYAPLRTYLKKKLHSSEDEIDTDVKVVIEASNGYYDGEENTSWLQGTSSSSTIITDGKVLVPKGIFTWPIPGYTTITSTFGMRAHPITGVYHLHAGVDVRCSNRCKFRCYG